MSYAHAFSASRLSRPPGKVASKATIHFLELIRPDGYWPQPYSLEQALGVLQWMVATGEEFRDRSTWGWHTIHGLLSCKPTCVNFNEIEPITSVDDIRNRLHHAILSRYVGPQLREWRRKFRVTPDGQAVVRFPHYRFGESGQSEHEFKECLGNLFSASGELKVQLNKFHKKAAEIQGVSLRLRQRWVFEMTYGYRRESSCWYKVLAFQGPKEPLARTMQRAVAKLGELT